MPQPLNRVPAGLLSLFQIKGTGDNPTVFDDDVQGVVDLSNHYFESIGISLGAASTPGVDQGDRGTSQAIVTVPDNELWLIRGISSSASVTTAGGAGEYCFVQTVLQNEPLNANITLSETPMVHGPGTGGFVQPWVQVIGESVVTSRWFDTPLVIPGGFRIVTSPYAIVTVTLALTLQTKVFYYVLEK